MTPTLLGRWQTRILLLSTVGVLITLPFALGIISPGGGEYFLILIYIAIFGIFWDIAYQYIQRYRWDCDWPAVLQLLAGIWEAVFVVAIATTIGLPGIPKEKFLLGSFFFHYSSVWLGVFVASQSLMRIFFPRSRFRGGQWL